MISARSLTARLLAEDVSEAMSNVNARGASMQAIQSSMRMLSSQAVPHFSHCKNILQEPMHASPVLPMCARLHLPSHHLCHGHSHLSKQQPWSTVGRQLSTSDAKSASAGKAAAVQAEFAKAGISAQATQKILKQYKTYLNWDIETKLRPAVQSWLQQLGTEQLSQQLQKLPRLLLCMPEEHNKVHSWLVSKGVNAVRVQQKAPRVMARDITAVQSTFEALQQAAAFSDAQMCTLLSKHALALTCGPECVLGTLQVVSALLDTPLTSDSFREAVLAANSRLFQLNPATVHQRVTSFYQMYATGTHVARTAITMGVFVTPEPVMQVRAATLQEQLGWDSEQLKPKLSAKPSLLTSEPSTIAHNVQAMQDAGFSQSQVWAMCTKQPALLGSKWTSDTNVVKLQFLTCLMGLRLDDIAARPDLLGSSVSSHLGPRVGFLYETGAIDATNTIMMPGLSSYLNKSKAVFSKRFNAPPAFPNKDLLLTSLPDRLAPRWQLLSRIASEQADFKAEDHLTALATLSDQDFSRKFHAEETSKSGTCASGRVACCLDT
ncbi:TPA: hypothetical protein ACH3X3_000032 [Trebouxia sp. C0006]